jgi:hypothetical protein
MITIPTSMNMKTTLAALALSVSALFLPCCGKKAGSAPGGQSGGTAGGVPLEVEFPPEIIEGTPRAIDRPGLIEAPKAAPSFLAPEGTVLLSKGKPVTCSGDGPLIGELSAVTDGSKEGGDGYYVELFDGPQWVQIDLGASAEVNAVWIWHFHSEVRAYDDVIVQISDDPEFKSGVTTVFNNDYDNSSNLGKGADSPYAENRFGKVVDGKGTKGRYVRLHSKGNSSNEMNHYIEVEVYGKAG